MLKWILKKLDGTWTVFISLKLCTSSGLLSTAKNFWFYKMRVLITAELSSSRKGLCIMELLTTANITLRFDVLV